MKLHHHAMINGEPRNVYKYYACHIYAGDIGEICITLYIYDNITIVSHRIREYKVVPTSIVSQVLNKSLP